jgi:putative CocE/NonD family hydrolase
LGENRGGGGAETQCGKKGCFFSEEKKQKTFANWTAPIREGRSQIRQKFLASFFQKRRPFVPLFVTTCLTALIPAAAAQTPSTLSSETPANFKPDEKSFDFARREEMIPMRDGVKLHTVILIPKGASHAPILLTRTPYDADDLTSYGHSAHLAMSLDGYDNADIAVAAGYIRVVQDVRGKYHSEGDYVMNRPLAGGPLNPTKVDDATDAYDTIDWLVHHTPESNGRVGTIGISYDGFTTLMTLFHPHPALKVAVPMNPMVDGWRGDDWFHNGAFRMLGTLNYIYEQEATRKNDEKWWTDHYDDYDTALETVSADGLAQTHDEDQIGFYRKLRAHPAYDSFWQAQAMDKLLSREPLTVPTMLVHSLWDQEDIYGAMAVYKALKPKDHGGDKLFLVMGPWHHGQGIEEGSKLGPVILNQDTGLQFRETILRPFLDHYLKDDAPPMLVAPVNAFITGRNQWEQIKAWPSGCDYGCEPAPAKLYLLPSGKLGFDAPHGAGEATVSYVSDPDKPVPFVQRPIHLLQEGEVPQWIDWLVSDQREASTRPDVLTFTTARLTAPVRIAGEPIANLVASTTGTDGDFVVKLIDVYPDEVPVHAELGGYQLMISADILRGRYRDGPEVAKRIPALEDQRYRFTLPNANHVFLPGHRIMVQVQSTWFPLYDRNPQTFVDNIFTAKPADYKKAEIRVRDGGQSFVELPMVKP